jgi:hypothetical protein
MGHKKFKAASDNIDGKFYNEHVQHLGIINYNNVWRICRNMGYKLKWRNWVLT